MSRNYRGDVEMSQIERFMTLLMEKEDEGKVSPILQQDDLSYIYIKHMNIYRRCPADPRTPSQLCPCRSGTRTRR